MSSITCRIQIKVDIVYTFVAVKYGNGYITVFSVWIVIPATSDAKSIARFVVTSY